MNGANRNDDATVHDHDHANPAVGSPARRVDALVARLEKLGITSESTINATLDRFLAGARPANGARLVARAWLDSAFKAELIADANTAIAAFGLDLSHWAPVRMRAVENTPDVHNVVVCTLCSCYPIALLGPSPGWYKSEAYRSRVVREPRAVLREFGCAIADDVHVRVWDSTAELRYFVLPQRPAQTESFDEAALAACVSRDALIGTALAALATEHPST